MAGKREQFSVRYKLKEPPCRRPSNRFILWGNEWNISDWCNYRGCQEISATIPYLCKQRYNIFFELTPKLM